ncbi:MAG: hypothetical protein R6V54_09765 [Desulfobacteraceae bacterium]
MFPFCFEWAWDAGHLLFFGGTWYTVGIIGAGLGYVLAKTIVDTVSGKGAGH